jgi:CRP-like cAMP-binding protein
LANISSKIDRIFKIPLDDKNILMARLERVKVDKATIVINAGKVERYVYFIEKGIARAYHETERGQKTIWFGEEGDVFLSFLSFFNEEPGYETIEVLEDSVLYRISSNELLELYGKYITIANWGRKLAEQELLSTERRFMDLQLKSASQRYQDLIKHTPTILQRVQLGYIASYLGITQVSLSRIRATVK